MVLIALLVPMLGCGLQNAVRHLYGASPLLDDFVPRSVFMLSPNEGWVAGDPGLDAPSSDTGIVLHLHHGKWARITIPTLGFDRVFALSSSDVWALDSSTGFYHYNGSAWRSAPLKIAPNAIEDLGLRDLYMLSPTEGWAVGATILHYTGGQWVDATNLATNPDWVQLESVSMVSTTDGWAVGGAMGGAVILHYDGTVWQRVPSPVAPPFAATALNLSAVWMVSATEGWAAGTANGDTDHTTALILHYTGGSWRIAFLRPTQPNTDVPLNTLAMVSPTEGWAAGRQEDSHISIREGNTVISSFISSYMLHYADGRWTEIPVPGAGIYSLSMGAPDDGWAIVPYGLLHYHRGVWTEALRG